MCSAVVSCPLCCQPNFPSVQSLRTTLVEVTNRPLTCPICMDVLLGLDKLTIHLFSHSINDPIPVIVNVDPIIIQSNQETDKSNILLNYPSEIKIEDIGISEPIELLPRCDICGSTFRTIELHRMHMRLVHDVSATDQPLNRFQCHLCSKYFKMKGSLRVHLRVVHMFGVSSMDRSNGNEQILGTESTLDQNSIDLNRIVGDVKTWECDICSKSFTTKYFLKKHKRLHTGEMPYTCELCNKTFTFQQSYHKHLLYHSDEKPHICNTCGRAFKELSTLHNHERIHSGEKPFKCETCDKCFRQRVSYLVHRRIHTGAMPYKCTACDKSFRYKVSQRTHKCAAQPPGIVIRQTGDLLQKLIQGTISTGTDTQSPIELREKSVEDDFLNQSSLDELVEESCNKMGIGSGAELDAISIPSPSEKLQSLCLYSPVTGDELFTGTGQSLQTINEDSLKQLLFGDSTEL